MILTWNEARGIEDCLGSLARQRSRDFEVIVVDAASTDGTAALVARAAPTFPVPLRLHVAPTRIRVGPARNIGVQMARADLIAFMSADAEADADWVAEALRAAPACDLMFGRQVHAPAAWSVGAAVRGLRYHFPETPTDDPCRFASNVNSVVRRHVAEAFPFGASAGASAVDDLLLAQRSERAGHRIRYNPAMIVRHRDVGSARAEWAKNVREGQGWGEHAAELGVHVSILVWAALLAVALGVAFAAPGVLTVLASAFILWAPALRRTWRRRDAMRRVDRLVGALASPAFDLAFLVAYVGGLVRHRSRHAPVPRPNAKVLP